MQISVSVQGSHRGGGDLDVGVGRGSDERIK